MPRCHECGMELGSEDEYHPYAACLMYRGCGSRQRVVAELKVVAEHARQEAWVAGYASRNVSTVVLPPITRDRPPSLPAIVPEGYARRRAD